MRNLPPKIARMHAKFESDVDHNATNQRKDVQQRITLANIDPFIVPGSARKWCVRCGGCGQRMVTDTRREYYYSLWQKHRDKCPQIAGGKWTGQPIKTKEEYERDWYEEDLAWERNKEAEKARDGASAAAAGVQSLDLGGDDDDYVPNASSARRKRTTTSPKKQLLGTPSRRASNARISSSPSFASVSGPASSSTSLSPRSLDTSDWPSSPSTSGSCSNLREGESPIEFLLSVAVGERL